MARYTSYRRGRYYRRGYRRGYRRYGGTSLRRYRSVQMNDNETKIMTFTGVSTVTLPVVAIDATDTAIPAGSVGVRPWVQLLNQSGVQGTPGTSSFTPSAGRVFFAGMMFDRLRVLSVSASARPLVLPSSSTTGNPTLTLYAAWDRYAGEEGEGSAAPTYSSIMTDPSAKSVTWTSGGSGSPLRTWVYATRRDRYQYISIKHNTSLVSWTPQYSNLADVFAPKLYFTLVGQNTVTAPPVQFQMLSRVVVEFQGGYSSTSLNYPASGASAASVVSGAPLEERVAVLERMYNANPADNNDDYVSVLNELSNPQ